LETKPNKWKAYRESGGPVGQAWIQLGAYAPIPFIKFGSAFVTWTDYKLWFAHPPANLIGPNWVTFKSGQDPHYLTATSTLLDSDGADRNAILKFDVGDPDPANPDAPPKTAQMTLHFRTGAWYCKWFRWRDLAYEDRAGWLNLFNSPPASEQKLTDLNADYTETSPVPGVLPLDHYALLATRRFSFTPGIYRFDTISDDGVRVFVDGKEIISRWDHHSGTADSVELPISAGTHDLRVEYCQEDGAAQLRVDWKKIQSGGPAVMQSNGFKRKRTPKESA
jgi:hypothetical protein